MAGPFASAAALAAARPRMMKVAPPAAVVVQGLEMRVVAASLGTLARAALPWQAPKLWGEPTDLFGAPAG